jgi:predicted CopG family antitoxin
MRNITVTIPDDAYRRARVWAAQRDTSVSEVVRHLLETLPGISRAARAFPALDPHSATPGPAPSAGSGGTK